MSWRLVCLIAVSASVACVGSEEDERNDRTACDTLDPTGCQERSDCVLSDVTVFRLDADGACEVVEEASECLERMTVTAGCAGVPCDPPSPAPWYEERDDAATAIVAVDRCGEGIAGWQECQGTEDGIIPPVCACGCVM